MTYSKDERMVLPGTWRKDLVNGDDLDLLTL